MIDLSIKNWQFKLQDRSTWNNVIKEELKASRRKKSEANEL